MIGDHYGDQFRKLTQNTPLGPDPFWQGPHFYPPTETFPALPPNKTRVVVPVDRDEFEALKKQVEEMKVLLEKAVEYDKRNNEPHCEQEEKIVLLKAVAEAVGVDLSTVFK